MRLSAALFSPKLNGNAAGPSPSSRVRHLLQLFPLAPLLSSRSIFCLRSLHHSSFLVHPKPARNQCKARDSLHNLERRFSPASHTRISLSEAITDRTLCALLWALRLRPLPWPTTRSGPASLRSPTSLPSPPAVHQSRAACYLRTACRVCRPTPTAPSHSTLDTRASSDRTTSQMAAGTSPRVLMLLRASEVMAISTGPEALILRAVLPVRVSMIVGCLCVRWSLTRVITFRYLSRAL